MKSLLISFKFNFCLVQVTVTSYHRLCGINNKHLFLTVLETGKSKVQMAAFSLCTHILDGEKGEEANSLMSLLLRALIPSWGLHPHNLITSQRLHLQISSHRGLEFQHMNPFGWRDTYLLKAYFFPIKLSRQLILFIPVENLLTMGIFLTDSEFIPFIYLSIFTEIPQSYYCRFIVRLKSRNMSHAILFFFFKVV